MLKHKKHSKLFFIVSLVLPLLPLQGGVQGCSGQEAKGASSREGKGSSDFSSPEKYLFKPNSKDLPIFERIFSNPHLFDSPEEMKAAGFKVNSRVHLELMVSTHPELKKYIFKKYTNKIPQDEQLAKYIHRINGARTIAKTLKKYQIQHLIVPKKGLYPLPPQFGENTYVVVAEYLDICTGDDHRSGENGQCYYNIPKEVLRELILVMHALGGCDAWPRNQPFTRQGQIAFVDTEHVGEKERHFARHIIPRLNPKMQQYATNLLNKLN